MTRSALIGSAAAHVAVLTVLFAVRESQPLIVPGPEVVQVGLVEPGAMPRVAAAPAAAEKAAMKAPDIKPEHAEGVKLAPPKKPPKKPSAPPKEEVAPLPASGTVLPYAQVGNAGLSGGVATDARDFEFTYYLMLIRNKVAQNWSPPAGLETGRQVQAVVYFRVSRGGGISSIRLETGSGVEFFDRSALRAVTLSDPLPPLPLGFPGSDLGIHFGFEYARP
ncbi:MAG TPA: TonB family protein [Terriglobales bacterium]|nr:TonB family protein [Terriglobales bacterium]